MSSHLLLLDGGMGSLLQKAGLGLGELPETWNLSHPDVITSIHRRYFDAGCNVVYTNTFGANCLKFSVEGDDRDKAYALSDIVSSAVALARRAVRESQSPQPKFVALDVGPSGKMLNPWGDFPFEDAVDLFKKTISAGLRVGVDLIVIETMNDARETKAALLAARELTDLPVFVTCAYGSDGKLMTGASPEAMCAMLESMGATAIGVNCSMGPDAMEPVVDRYLSSTSLPVILKPNAGLPQMVDGNTVYDVTPKDFSASVMRMIRKGVQIAGGCCGTTPEYLEALAEAIQKEGITLPERTLPGEHTVISSYAHAVTFGETPVLIGERINPTGKKRMKQALQENDLGYLLNEGITQEEAGCHVLDVNVGLPGIDEAAILERTVEELQAVTSLPLQLDTADPAAMERAMRVYIGKPLVNSVSGTEKSMHAIFPLVKKYGGTVICLTLDEGGIPETAEGRLRVAEKIVETAASYGISRKDLIVDPLAMTISSGKDQAEVTLKAITLIRDRLHVCTSLGVSNVSFGLPCREGIHSAFFLMALQRGLSAAILNPFSYDMMRTYHAYLALKGLDDQCGAYIGFVTTHAPASSQAPATPAQQTGSASQPLEDTLQSAVVHGLKQKARMLAEEGTRTRDPLSLIEEEIIPALNQVGDGFEKKTVFLPQLLMSAEAASEAFDVLRTHMLAASGSAQKRTGATFVLATVHGDIHDIGKNIVRLLMESYGFDVVDLGRDVPKETVVEAVLSRHAPICGLSALMTTTVPAMEETIQLLREKAPFCKIVVGGAVLTQRDADRIGADAYAKDAMACVRWAQGLNLES
ncbi:MAG: homocysteine S-methyltransferase family protein [Clostridia bacterium]|nr:homocysteine S-methyltransferase family protein [Clostridia bacterium]